jgi:hypothetical protein
MQALPIDKRGYVVPWFVEWINGEPEFRAMSRQKFTRAITEKLCWVCGNRLGANLCFVIGPMCGVNRISSEPPSHLDCARWSARNCPFLTRPHMVRREDDLLNNQTIQETSAGVCLTRNPGVTALWVTRDYRLIRDGKGFLFNIGDPHMVEWYAEGKPATRAQIEQSVETGLPSLMEMAEAEGPDAVAELLRGKQNLEVLYPPCE